MRCVVGAGAGRRDRNKRGAKGREKSSSVESVLSAIEEPASVSRQQLDALWSSNFG